MDHLSLWSRPLGTPPAVEVCIILIPVSSWACCVSRDVVQRSTYNVSSYLSSSLFQDLPAPSNKDSSSWLPLPSLLSFRAASPVLTMALVGWSLEKSGWGSTHLHPEPCCSLQTSGDLPLWESPFSGGLRNCVLSTLGQEQGGRQFVCEFCPLLWKAAGF